MIKNRTFYKGKIYLKFEKFPHYSCGDDFFNKIHINLGFTKLVSRIKCDYDNRYNIKFLQEIADKTNLQLVTSYYKGIDGTHIRREKGVSYKANLKIDGADFDITLPTHDKDICALVHYTNTNDDYISLDSGYMAYANNMKATESAQIFECYEKNKLIGYCGYSHRAAVIFKIGDKIFQSTWMPEDNSEETRENTKFTEHGYKTITTFDQAKIAAHNFARYVS